MSDSDSDAGSDQGEQIRVSLTLAKSVKDRSLEVPSEPIAVPSDIGRKGLSAVINHLLGRDGGKDSDDDSDDDDAMKTSDGPAAIPFEFVLTSATNKLLRKGVEKEARQHGLSLERAVEISYFPAALQPELSADKEELPDWISGLSVCDDLLFAGCYDGSMHVYDIRKDGSVHSVLADAVSTGPVKCMDTKRMAGRGNRSSIWVATASLAHTLHLHQYDTTSKQLRMHALCKQEEQSSPITSVAFARGKHDIFCSGDTDGNIYVWDPNTVENTSTKRAKHSDGSKSSSSSSSSAFIQPKISLTAAHTQQVSGLSWGNSTPDNTKNLVTGSYDHSLKLWDVNRQDCLLTLNGSRVVTCLDTSYYSDGVVATGHPDCTIRLWDLRVSGSDQSSVIVDNTFRPSHKAWVSQVAWSPASAYHLTSTSHDGTVKLWDIRSSLPLHSMRVFAKEEKSLSLGIFDGSGETGAANGMLFAGGTDCILKSLKAQ